MARIVNGEMQRAIVSLYTMYLSFAWAKSTFSSLRTSSFAASEGIKMRYTRRLLVVPLSLIALSAVFSVPLKTELRSRHCSLEDVNLWAPSLRVIPMHKQNKPPNSGQIAKQLSLSNETADRMKGPFSARIPVLQKETGVRMQHPSSAKMPVLHNVTGANLALQVVSI